MNVLLLSASKGTRLAPLTLKTPKCLLPLINDKPILKYWIDTLTEIGIETIFINIYWLKDKIAQYIDTLDKNIKKKIYLYQEDYLEPVGEVLSKLRPDLGNPILIINSDTYIKKEEVKKFIWMTKDCTYRQFLICLAIEKRESIKDKSLVTLNKERIITDFIEKPDNDQAGYSYAGIMLMDSSVISSYETEELIKKELTKDIVPDFKNRMIGLEIKGAIDIGDSLETYYQAYEKIK